MHKANRVTVAIPMVSIIATHQDAMGIIKVTHVNSLSAGEKPVTMTLLFIAVAFLNISKQNVLFLPSVECGFT
ncbi:MAG: hypothetical protein R3271_00040 [Methylophaga sp.]|uniref:hypothetical protein n=1 Tax=Methylophaga sp. TaxID=2024840 RepID=UPI00299DABF2|nr:hypothetical protein [Methylophaga sp.]MDX1748687.1 hypothetical protein [Methylophaga sp.]|tara:strand:- start:4712 stop:4930 length:219 start_codon:yes stop_codon:yes gene_type:complete